MKSVHTSGIEQCMWTRHYTPPVATKSKKYSETHGLYLKTKVYCPQNLKSLIERKMEPIIEGYTDRNGDVRPVDLNEIFEIEEGDEFDIDNYHFRFVQTDKSSDHVDIDGEGKWDVIGLNLTVNEHTIFISSPGIKYDEDELKKNNVDVYFILYK